MAAVVVEVVADEADLDVQVVVLLLNEEVGGPLGLQLVLEALDLRGRAVVLDGVTVISEHERVGGLRIGGPDLSRFALVGGRLRGVWGSDFLAPLPRLMLLIDFLFYLIDLLPHLRRLLAACLVLLGVGAHTAITSIAG